MQQATTGQLKESLRKAGALKPSHGSRTRPTNNQLLYRATFQWEHYRKTLHGNPKLPDATEACASVTSAFLQVVGVLFEVERLREDQPRNILRLLSSNTRRTKVVELSSGTHRVPEELKRHSIGDGEGGQYSTNLDRNRYGSDDQYLATVVRYNLDYLSLCPCLVDITILDAKGGVVSIVVSAGAAACRCGTGVPKNLSQGDGRQQRMVRTLGSKRPDAEVEEAHPPPDAATQAETPSPAPADSEETGKPAEKRMEAAAPSKSNGGSELFDALLMAAAEPQVSSRPNAKVLTPRQYIGRSNCQDGESNTDSRMHGDELTKSQGDGLRRSSRKSVKLFNAAALEREGSGESEEGTSVHSIEDDTETTPRARGQTEEPFEGTFPAFKGRRASILQRGASAANLSKLNRPLHDNRRHTISESPQKEVLRLRQQLGATEMMLEESRLQAMEAREQIRQLQDDLNTQTAVVHKHRDQVANLKAEVQLLVKAGAKGSGGLQNNTTPPEFADQMLSAIMLKDAQEALARLEHEKAALCNTLSAAGLPLPFPGTDIATPQLNGERPLNGFGPIGTPGSSAFSVPLAVQPYPGFQQYIRGLAPPLPPIQLKPSQHTQGIDDHSKSGSATPHSLHQLPSPRTSLWPTLKVQDSPRRSIANGKSSCPEGTGIHSAGGLTGQIVPSKRKLEEKPVKELAGKQ